MARRPGIRHDRGARPRRRLREASGQAARGPACRAGLRCCASSARTSAPSPWGLDLRPSDHIIATGPALIEYFGGGMRFLDKGDELDVGDADEAKLLGSNLPTRRWTEGLVQEVPPAQRLVAARYTNVRSPRLARTPSSRRPITSRPSSHPTGWTSSRRAPTRRAPPAAARASLSSQGPVHPRGSRWRGRTDRGGHRRLRRGRDG